MHREPMESDSRTNFVRMQGFRGNERRVCELHYSGLMVQPRIVGLWVLAATILQSWAAFLALAIVLAWNAAVPSWNLFELIYNRVIARPRGSPPIPQAPAPRRFAQAFAGTWTALIAITLLSGSVELAWVLEAILFLALGALIFGRFCLGSYLYYLLRGDKELVANSMPWSRTESSS